MEETKPSFDYDIVTATIKFKEWKNKPTYFMFTHAVHTKMDLIEEVKKLVDEWRERGLNKRRTIEEVTLKYGLHIKV